MPSGRSDGLFSPTPAQDMQSGDLLIVPDQVDWTELLVVGVHAEDDETLLVLMEEDGTLRSWDGPSRTRHTVLRRLNGRGRSR